MSDETYTETERLAAHLHTNEALYREALSTFARRMRENAETMHATALAGGNGLVTREAAQSMVESFNARADQAVRVMTELSDLIWGRPEDDEEQQ